MLAAGRRTYLPMSVLAGILAVTFVVYILLYRKLSPPRTFTSEADSSDSDEEVVPMHVIMNDNCEVDEEEKTREEEEKEEEEEVEGGSEGLEDECNSTLL